MENKNTKLPFNSTEDIKINSINDFEFIRQRNIRQEKNNEQKPYSILQKTNNIFGYKNIDNNSLDNKIYNTPVTQKEKINLYSNQNNILKQNNNIISNTKIESSINRIQNKIEEVENDINLININRDNNINLNYGKNFQNNEMLNKNTKYVTVNNQLPEYKGFYFNYKSDESFNRLNEQNIKSISDIKINSIYNTNYYSSNNIYSNSNNFEYNSNSIMLDIKNVENNNDYKGYMNQIEKRNELINQNTFESLNKNASNNYDNNNFNNYNQFMKKNNLRNDYSSRALSVNKNMIKQNEFNLEYNINNNDLKTSKSNNNIFNNNYNNKSNNDSLYNTEKVDNNLKSYFQLKEKDIIHNYDDINNDISLNKNNQTLSSLMDETSKEKDYFNKNSENINSIKSLKNYHSFSTTKNNYTNINQNLEENIIPKNTFGNMNDNYRVNTNENKKDEMTQTIPTEDIKFYSLTQNRCYRNQRQNAFDNQRNTFDNDVNNIIHFNTNNNNLTYNENKQFPIPKKINEINDENCNNNNIQFNTVSNNNFHQNNHNFNNRCIHKCNSYRNKKINKNEMNLFKRNNKNLGFNRTNRNICEKCLKSKINFAKLNQLRICNNCQNLINSGNFNINKNNYFTFN